jgi:hypothetical protein
MHEHLGAPLFTKERARVRFLAADLDLPLTPSLARRGNFGR